jgi:hypothetical protein
MSEAKATYMGPGVTATAEDVQAVEALVRSILANPDFLGKPLHIVLNALCSAHWTAACMAGQQVQAAEGLVRMGGSYLAGLALAQQAAPADADKPVVH